MGLGFRRVGRTRALVLLGVLLAASLLALPREAAADWRLYANGELGYSVSKGEASGNVDIAGVGTVSLGGSDKDVSPLLGGTFGLVVPMDEIAPIEMPRGWHLPKWDVRAEVEAVGLRNFKYTTAPIVTNEGRILTEIDCWTLMGNFWLDIPMRGLYRPISWTSARLFGRWRLRILKEILDRTSFELGAGVGVASLDAKTQESQTRGRDTAYNFAWQAGGGFDYSLTDRVSLTLGYRYIDPGTAKYDLRNGGVQQGSDFKLDPQIHEVVAGVRVEVWDFAVPWR